MKFHVNLVSYNRMGGHPTISFLGDLLLSSSKASFGGAVAEIEAYAHLETAGLPLRTLEPLEERFRKRVAMMPQAWFHRNIKRIEIAYFSHLGDADALIQGRSRAVRLDDVPLVRVGYRELAKALEIVQNRVRATDDFDVAAFLEYVRTRETALNDASDREVYEGLSRLQAIERQRVVANSVA